MAEYVTTATRIPELVDAGCVLIGGLEIERKVIKTRMGGVPNMNQHSWRNSGVYSGFRITFPIQTQVSYDIFSM